MEQGIITGIALVIYFVVIRPFVKKNIAQPIKDNFIPQTKAEFCNNCQRETFHQKMKNDPCWTCTACKKGR